MAGILSRFLLGHFPFSGANLLLISGRVNESMKTTYSNYEESAPYGSSKKLISRQLDLWLMSGTQHVVVLVDHTTKNLNVFLKFEVTLTTQHIRKKCLQHEIYDFARLCIISRFFRE